MKKRLLLLISILLVVGCSKIIIDGPQNQTVYLTNTKNNYPRVTDYHVRYAFGLIPTVSYEGMAQNAQILTSDLNHTYKVIGEHGIKKCYVKVYYSLHDWIVDIVVSVIPVVGYLSFLYNGARTVEIYGE